MAVTLPRETGGPGGSVDFDTFFKGGFMEGMPLPNVTGGRGGSAMSRADQNVQVSMANPFIIGGSESERIASMAIPALVLGVVAWLVLKK